HSHEHQRQILVALFLAPVSELEFALVVAIPRRPQLTQTFPAICQWEVGGGFRGGIVVLWQSHSSTWALYSANAVTFALADEVANSYKLISISDAV
ncbi:hypothetical protein RUND412_005851, partial [Rhizina undulata]